MNPILLLLLCATAAANSTSCTGASSGLDPDQCIGFQKFFNETGGTGWGNCKNRLDPCSCEGARPGLDITCEGADITKM